MKTIENTLATIETLNNRLADFAKKGDVVGADVCIAQLSDEHQELKRLMTKSTPEFYTLSDEEKKDAAADDAHRSEVFGSYDELIEEFEVKENKKSYSVVGDVSVHLAGAKKPTMKKIMWGHKIAAPTAYRVYICHGSVTTYRGVWVFGEREANIDSEGWARWAAK